MSSFFIHAFSMNFVNNLNFFFHDRFNCPGFQQYDFFIITSFYQRCVSTEIRSMLRGYSKLFYRMLMLSIGDFFGIIKF